MPLVRSLVGCFVYLNMDIHLRAFGVCWCVYVFVVSKYTAPTDCAPQCTTSLVFLFAYQGLRALAFTTDYWRQLGQVAQAQKDLVFTAQNTASARRSQVYYSTTIVSSVSVASSCAFSYE